MRIGNFVLYKEKAGVISSNEIWIIFHSCWMYTGNSLIDVFKQFILEYKLDRHLVG